MAIKTPVVLTLIAGVIVTASSHRVVSQDFEEWSRERQRAFEQYRTQREQKFLEYLEQRWEAMKTFAGRSEDTVPKPDVFPTAPSDSDPPNRKLEPVREEPDGPGRDRPPEPPDDVPPEPADRAPEPDPEKPAGPLQPSGPSQPEASDEPTDETPEESPPKGLTVDYYGRSPSLSRVESIRDLGLRSKDSEGLKTFWADFSGRKTGPLVDELTDVKDDLAMDGWAYLQFLRGFTTKLYDDRGTAVAATWALLLKSGYRARVGYNDQSLALLVRTSTTLYEIPYLTVDGERFYLLVDSRRSSESRSLTTYRNPYPGDQRPLEVSPAARPRLKPDPAPRRLTFDFNDREVIVNFRLDRRAVEYLSELPQLPLERYFTSLKRIEVSTNLTDVLDRKLEDVPPRDRLEFLLRFVQTAFEYKTDGEQFGREDYLLPVETLYYPYSDCEDRALLFSKLVDQLLDRRVVGLDYPGHVATAVKIDGRPSGSYLTVSREPFLVADPTYVNARPGMVMPKYQNQNPSVIPTWLQRRASAYMASF